MIIDKIYLIYQNKIFLNNKFNDLLDPYIFELENKRCDGLFSPWLLSDLYISKLKKEKKRSHDYSLLEM